MKILNVNYIESELKVFFSYLDENNIRKEKLINKTEIETELNNFRIELLKYFDKPILNVLYQNLEESFTGCERFWIGTEEKQWDCRFVGGGDVLFGEELGMSVYILSEKLKEIANGNN